METSKPLEQIICKKEASVREKETVLLPEAETSPESVSAVESVSPAISTPPEISDKYLFLKKLGQGNQGGVFQAKRLSDGEIVAIKQLRVESVSNWKSYELFQREAQVLSSIHVDGVCQFFEAQEFLEAKPPSAYIVQQFIPGHSIGEMMKSGYRFTITRVFELMLQLLDILEKIHLHSPAVIHRDIKPSNILLKPLEGDDFKLYLIDFGAVANPQVQQGGSTVAGTYGYMPPEQLVGRPLPASDIYAMGAMLAYMLSGVEPADMRVVDFRLIIDPWLENIPGAVTQVLRKMLEPDPQKRLCDYSVLRNHFANFARNQFIQKGKNVVLSASSEELLLNIKKLNQVGSLDLWMQLNDVSLPDTIKHKSVDDELLKHFGREVSLKYLMQFAGLLPVFSQKIKKQLNNRFESRNEIGSIYTLATGVSVLLGLIVALILQNVRFFNFFVNELRAIGMADDSSIRMVYFLGFCVVIFPFVLATVFAIIYKIYKSITSLMNGTKVINVRKSPKLRKVDPYDDRNPMVRLLRLGAKTIATVVDFKYVSVKNSGFLNDSLLDKLELNDYRDNYTSYGLPEFALRYRFNPPDDACSDDLIHTVIVHKDMSDVLSPGMPLPILYYINPKDNSDVISVPYPMVFDPFMTHDKIIGKSRAWDKPKK